MSTNWRTHTDGIVTLADVEARLRSLECGRRSCICHRTARLCKGPTHCPCHGPDNNPSLSVTVTVEGTVLVRCHAQCEQMMLWNSLFGDVIIAWEKARWEAGAYPSDVWQHGPRDVEPIMRGVDVP